MRCGGLPAGRPRIIYGKSLPARPLVDQQSPRIVTLETRPGSRRAAAVIYIVAFVTGAIVMSFEMLGSRYLNPYFGSGIYTWAALISTVLLALTLGYFLGGYLADRTASAAVLALTVIVGSVYLLALPSFAGPVLEFVLAAIEGEIDGPRACGRPHSSGPSSRASSFSMIGTPSRAG